MGQVVKAFFSYAHLDAETAPALFSTLTPSLEKAVNSKLVKHEMAIWRDREGLRLGDHWNDRIEAELQGSDILIVMLSPSWMRSENCRKEFLFFREGKASAGGYVAPVLTRSFGDQVRHFSGEQEAIATDLLKRQYLDVSAPAFATLSSARRGAIIDKIADDLAGMVDRIGQLRETPLAAITTMAPRGRRAEFTGAAHSYAEIDLISAADVAIANPDPSGARNVLAQINFVEKLFIECDSARFEFGVRRAYLSVWSTIAGALDATADLRGSTRHVARHGRPDAISICIDPSAGKRTLAELSLPVSPSENYYSHVGVLRSGVSPNTVHAELDITFTADGLTLLGNQESRMPARTKRKIEAIMIAALAKQNVCKSGDVITRSVDVKGRDA